MLCERMAIKLHAKDTFACKLLFDVFGRRIVGNSIWLVFFSSSCPTKFEESEFLWNSKTPFSTRLFVFINANKLFDWCSLGWWEMILRWAPTKWTIFSGSNEMPISTGYYVEQKHHVVKHFFFGPRNKRYSPLVNWCRLSWMKNEKNEWKKKKTTCGAL